MGESNAAPTTEETKVEDPKSLNGKIVTLGYNAIWKSPSGKVDLNLFTGNVSHKITKDIDDIDRASIVKALSHGLLVFTDKEVKAKPFKLKNDGIPTSLSAEAYRRVDMAGSEMFTEVLKHTTNATLLKEMINVEESERNRIDILTLIKKQLQEITS